MWSLHRVLPPSWLRQHVLRLYCHVCEKQYLSKRQLKVRRRRPACVADAVRTSAHVIAPPASLIVVFFSRLRASPAGASIVAQDHFDSCGGRRRAMEIKSSRDISVMSLRKLDEIEAAGTRDAAELADRRQHYLDVINTNDAAELADRTLRTQRVRSALLAQLKTLDGLESTGNKLSTGHNLLRVRKALQAQLDGFDAHTWSFFRL